MGWLRCWWFLYGDVGKGPDLPVGRQCLELPARLGWCQSQWAHRQDPGTELSQAPPHCSAIRECLLQVSCKPKLLTFQDCWKEHGAHQAPKCCSKSLTAAQIQSQRIRTHPRGLCPFGNKFPVFWQGNILNCATVSTLKSINPIAAVSFLPSLRPPFNLKEEETRVISHCDFPVILMCLVADQGKASQYSKLKISTRLCYEERVPSRYTKEMSAQLPPLASPTRHFPTSKADVSDHLASGWPYNVKIKFLVF